MAKKAKALVLLSGGLDSRLAAKILQEQLGNKQVEALYIRLPFISRREKNLTDVKEFCREEKIKIHVIDCTKGRLFQEYIKIIKRPKFGRGSALNPCIDCHIFMLKLAKKLNFDIVATGEVLGQRPMSQHKPALQLIEKESGLQGKLLRPLSARLISPTIAEKKGFIDRKKLFSIKGRNRSTQLMLAKKFNIDFPHPAGGCLLCENEFCKKVSPLLKNLSELDAELLKVGRHFQKSSIVLGKNYEENQRLAKIKRKFKKGFLLDPKEPGPTAFVKSKAYIKKAKELIQKYSKHKITKFTVK